MANIFYCKKCDEYTEHKYLGREKLQLDSEEKFFSVVNIGIYPLMKKLTNPKYYKCKQCGKIIKISKD